MALVKQLAARSIAQVPWLESIIPSVQGQWFIAIYCLGYSAVSPEKESHGPNPLRSLVVVESVGHRGIV